MTPSRRVLLAAPIGSVVAATSAKATIPDAKTTKGVVPNFISDSKMDQSRTLQNAIDTAATAGCAVLLPPGTFLVGNIRLRAGTKLIAQQRSTTLAYYGGGSFITGDKCHDLVMSGITFDGQYQPIDENQADGLIAINNSKNCSIESVQIISSPKIGLALNGVNGRVHLSHIADCLDAGIKALDSRGLAIQSNVIENCSNNGILVWRSEAGPDGTQVLANRIDKIRNAAGGTGQYGNGVNIFRANDVQVLNNTITNCTYSAVRGNAASNILIQANTCRGIGEVALYAEFGFEGAVIANNIVDGAAAGIAVTNFNEGGRLAVVSGNLIRNLRRRESEPEDKRGEGIGVEADAVVTGNTIENAPTAGIQIGWGRYMRDVAVTGNVIRKSAVGISVTASADAGQCLIANNMISGVANGAVRTMHHGVLVGPDLAKDGRAPAHITVAGNVAV